VDDVPARDDHHALVEERRKASTEVEVVEIEIGGSFIGLLSVLKVLHLLYWGQMIGGGGFALVLVTIFPRLIENRRDDAPSRASAPR
jgi:hypothetical protein